ncbi:CYTH domain-containing protein [Methylobacterium brachiatum]|uniref:CYTH domain-containing protein n=1 Tax=Methylobacterium brachiatum TaxID=269660 RepID=UPI00244AB39C|nr:CYTH domain-containing protein [Methylobacterium brachiatum]MDH2312345.1 CYTH domain-containing protein [Methylobacterium brachiatum]
MSEPREIEFKLECERSDIVTIQAHPLVREASEQGATDLGSTYFDTAEQRLREARLGLRLRRIGERYVQTLKAEGDSLFRRPERAQEVP